MGSLVPPGLSQGRGNQVTAGFGFGGFLAHGLVFLDHSQRRAGLLDGGNVDVLLYHRLGAVVESIGPVYLLERGVAPFLAFYLAVGQP